MFVEDLVHEGGSRQAADIRSDGEHHVVGEDLLAGQDVLLFLHH